MLPQAAIASDCTLTQTVIRSEYSDTSVTYTIPIVFHVISKTDGTGNISDAAINAQVQVLNEDYRALPNTMGSQGSDVRIQFELAGITRTVNSAWHQYDSYEATYKSATGWDRANYLNIWTTSADGLLGYAYFPADAAGDNLDGIVVNHESVGGRDNGYGEYNQGRTLTHEIGHYLGLYHTFEACGTGYTAGDLIDDTPSEDTPTYNCIQSYSCSTADAITNYMNYTPDDCMNNFTPEQANRMVCSLLNYRPSLYEKTTTTTTNPAINLLLLH